MKVRSALLLLAATAAAASGQDRLAPGVQEYVVVEAPAVALTGVRLIDGTGAAPQRDVTVLIEGGVIGAVVPAADAVIPDGARVLELSGHTVIPGIVGLHQHTYYALGRYIQLNYSAPRLYLASGVTTIRTAGSISPYAEMNLKRSIDRGEIPGPRMFHTGPYLTGGSTATDMYLLSGAEDARRVVSYWAEEGAAWLKVYTEISRRELRAVIEQAHRHGMKVTGHLCSVTYAEAIDAGIDNLEHGFLAPLTDFVSGKEPDTCPPDAGMSSLAGVEVDSPQVRRLIDDLVEAGVALTSTLAVTEGMVPGRPPLDPRVLQLMAPTLLADFTRMREAVSGFYSSFPAAEIYRKGMAFERAFVAAGGLLGAGVDPVGTTLHGLGDQRNYELLREAGFSAPEAIRIMTLNGAAILGVQDRLGSVEAGKIADLVVIAGDPVGDPAAIRNTVLTFKDGRGYDPAALLESVEGMVGIR